MKKKLLALVLVVAFLVAFAVGCAGKGASFTVEVTHADQTTKEFTYTSDADMLGEVLMEEGLVVGEMGEYGLMISEVDGEQAIYEVDNAYWSLLINGEYAQTGVDSTPIEDGAVYSLVYTPAE